MQTIHATTTPAPIQTIEEQLLHLDTFYVQNRHEFLKWSYKMFFLSPDEATDIYQDAVIVLFENYQKGKLVELHSTMKTYFYGIAKNLISAYLKKRNKQRLYTDVRSYTEWENYATLGYDNNDETAIREEMLAHAVQKLPAKGQSIMQLFYYEKKSLREITQILGYTNEAVVKSTKMRYKKELRKILEQSMQNYYTL